MKVLFVTKGFYDARAGAESAARDWYLHLRQRSEVEASLLTDKAGRIRRILDSGSTNILFAGHPITFAAYSAKMTSRMAEICKKMKPDLVHIHSYSGNVVFPIDIPTVVTLHDEPAVQFQDRISSPLSALGLGLIRQSADYMRRMMLSRTRYVHALSSSIKNQLQDMFPSIHSRVIPNPFYSRISKEPTMTKEVLLSNLDVQGNSKIVLSVGNISYRKRQHLLIEAATLMRRTDVHFFIAGRIPSILHESYHKALLDCIKDRNLQNVHLLGYVNDDLLHNLFSHTDVYVSPAVSEACNLALQEAAQYGIPIVATEAGAAKDLFEGQAVILERHCSGQDVAEGISKSLNRPILDYRSSEEYTWKRVIDSLLLFYSHINEV